MVGWKKIGGEGGRRVKKRRKKESSIIDKSVTGEGKNLKQMMMNRVMTS
jgi:hypothetical protein